MSRKCLVICGFVVGAVLILLAVAAVLVYIYFPREPTVTWEKDQFAVQKFTVGVAEITLEATAKITVDNPNYATIKVDYLDWEVFHEDKKMGTVEDENFEFPARKATTRDIPIEMTTTDPTIVAAITADAAGDGLVTLRFNGPIKVSYLAASLEFEIDEEQELAPTA